MVTLGVFQFNKSKILILFTKPFLVALVFVMLASVVFAAPTPGEGPGALDLTFNPGAGPITDGIIYQSAIQSDGKIIISGDFSQYQNVLRPGIARLNTDGSLDETFDPGDGPDSVVNGMIVLSDGKIIILGSFTEYNGIAINFIARLNTDGSLDETFEIEGTGFDNEIADVAVQVDGKIIVVGSFTEYNGTSRSSIARLNTDGSLDETFEIEGTGFNDVITSGAIQSDGKIIVIGDFSAYNTTFRSGLARLNTDGSLDTDIFIPISGFDDYPIKVILQSDGKFVAIGGFGLYGDVFVNNLARLNTDGSLDETFEIEGTGFDDYRSSDVVIQSDNKIVLIGAGATEYNGTPFLHLARLNTDGSLDETFEIEGTGFSLPGSDKDVITSGAIQSDNKIIVGGNFTEYNGVPSEYIARLNTDGSLDTSFELDGTGFDGGTLGSGESMVGGVAVQPDGKIMVMGRFNEYNGTARAVIARLNTDGSLDETFEIEGTGFDDFVQGILFQSDNKIIVRGSFTEYNGTPTNYLARLNTDGSLDETFEIEGTGFDDVITSGAIQSDNKIIVGGNFTEYNGVPSEYIARLNTDGSLDETFEIEGTGFPPPGGYKMVIQSDNKVVLGGNFTNYNAIPRQYLARLQTDEIVAEEDDESQSSGNSSGSTRRARQANTREVLSETICDIAFGSPSLVKQGSRGMGALSVQKSVNQMKAVTPPLLEDGIIGPKSVAGMKLAQMILKTTPDGYWGPITQGLYQNWVTTNCKTI